MATTNVAQHACDRCGHIERTVGADSPPPAGWTATLDPDDHESIICSACRSSYGRWWRGFDDHQGAGGGEVDG